MGSTREPPVCENQPQECMHKRLWCAKLKELCLLIRKEKKATAIHQILRETQTTMGEILALR
jgi:hypothetical protein